MTPHVNIPNSTTRGIISTLRPPCALNLTLKKGYSDDPSHPGQVLVLPNVTEPVIAPGSGLVMSVVKKYQSEWDHASGELDKHQTFEIRLDNGGYITTVVHGLSSVSIVVGQYVTRGDILGYARTTEIFFQMVYRSKTVDPASMSHFFRMYDGGKVPDKVRQVKAGPDFISRAVSRTWSMLIGGIRYFFDRYASKPELLISIDFNGNGEKTGPAATGITSIDYWNVYDPVEFSTSSSAACYSYFTPSDEETASESDSAESDYSFYEGGTFQVVFETSGTDAATNTVSFYLGSTETIPEVDPVLAEYSYYSGSLFDVSITTRGTDYGSNSLSFYSGSLFDAVVYAFGTASLGVPNVYSEYGTNNMSFYSGELFESVVYAFGSTAPGVGNVYSENGTTYLAFISGGTETLVFETYATEYMAGTIAFTSGSIHQF